MCIDMLYSVEWYGRPFSKENTVLYKDVVFSDFKAIVNMLKGRPNECIEKSMCNKEYGECECDPYIAHCEGREKDHHREGER